MDDDDWDEDEDEDEDENEDDNPSEENAKDEEDAVLFGKVKYAVKMLCLGLLLLHDKNDGKVLLAFDTFFPECNKTLESLL
jgi:hypothetical protein